MESGFSHSVTNLFLDNIDEDKPTTNSTSTSVMNHQDFKEFKEKINPVFENMMKLHLIT